MKYFKSITISIFMLVFTICTNGFSDSAECLKCWQTNVPGSHPASACLIAQTRCKEVCGDENADRLNACCHESRPRSGPAVNTDSVCDTILAGDPTPPSTHRQDFVATLTPCCPGCIVNSVGTLPQFIYFPSPCNCQVDLRDPSGTYGSEWQDRVNADFNACMDKCGLSCSARPDQTDNEWAH
jgi:hypothetical protein